MQEAHDPWRAAQIKQQRWIFGGSTLMLLGGMLLFYNLASCTQATNAKVADKPTAASSSSSGSTTHSRSTSNYSMTKWKTYPKKYVAHIKALHKRLPPGFTVVVEPPFVVVGDETPGMVRSRSKNTVRWAVNQLKRLYFPKDPDHIITVWLFANRASYTRNTWKLFREQPGTPFGYYSPRHKALIMNIATGGGTLVHEIVHPFMDANFKQCPAWFNEGMGSLYEQCGERRGRIVGFTNWRLAGLQRAIRSKILPSFKTLTHTTTNQFYNEDPGSHYAQARYLMYYLQEKGLLLKYYREFTKNHASDPTGYKTLKRILRVKDMTAFQKKWERWVLKLRF